MRSESGIFPPPPLNNQSISDHILRVWILSLRTAPLHALHQQNVRIISFTALQCKPHMSSQMYSTYLGNIWAINLGNGIRISTNQSSKW